MTNQPGQPLAERMRPGSLEEVTGQEHLTSPGKVLHSSLHGGHLHSMIFWGPPGTGKTTLAKVVSAQAGLPFYQLSAISSGVKEIREVIEMARRQGKAILFIDEIHRFSKNQQDALLGAVEKGTLLLIGATTENPAFEVNAALLSRAQVYVLNALDKSALQQMVLRALKTDDWLSRITVETKEWEALLRMSGGDGRRLLNLLEMVVQHLLAGNTGNNPIVITNEAVIEAGQLKMALYDKQGEQHYDIISAFIKSMRGSDPNGAVYWLARMIAGGENPEFIARRMLIFASEDVGMANANALLLANTTFEAVQKIGWPESRIILSQCAVYLATSPKSNTSYNAIASAQEAVTRYGDQPVPMHLRNAPAKLMKELGYGENYQYSHLGEDNFITQEYLPESVSGTAFYEPGRNARENEVKNFLAHRWKGKYGYD